MAEETPRQPTAHGPALLIMAKGGFQVARNPIFSMIIDGPFRDRAARRRPLGPHEPYVYPS
ncbi:hypothetical protein [Jiangella mangrovi]|uniref:hypothetical protein n=1 Tax=Jiangella mangrovi TaxID=1524084 RepID=UPI00160FF979|nr:hypothetical protein [Jiangella mangrovi]